MGLAKRYDPQEAEPAWQAQWDAAGAHRYVNVSRRTPYVIDTPPPTVSGRLHLGHVYSYCQTDFLARFWRMNGRDVLYPMGYDDNGLPTERLVERTLGIHASDVGRQAFIDRCLAVGEANAREYEALWQRLGLSVDWRYTYRTIGREARRLAQLSFLHLLRRDLAYRALAPAIWCPECRTAIAQAEVDDLERESELVTLAFALDDGEVLPIATTRPEMLPACVAVFVHPGDPHRRKLAGRKATVPLFGQQVPILADEAADPQKGTGAVMCCTFGDAADVAWWRSHALGLVAAIGPDGRMTAAAGPFEGQSVAEARAAVIAALANEGELIARRPISQTVRVHERCDTPVEFILASQWFVRLLPHKAQFLAAGERVSWHPAHMAARYRHWVENLSWDWCLSRQRAFGVPFPIWTCDACGELIAAGEQELPVDPAERGPSRPCSCGSTTFTPDTDVMDTWATSSLTPQLVGRWLGQSGFDGEPFQPLALRPQAHDIIRTWAFYTIVMAEYHTGKLPWQDVAISGWGLAQAGAAKISKSRGGGPVSPETMIARYSADALRYWAASTGLGKDALISEEKIQAGARLATKIFNVGRFAERFLSGYRPPQTRPPLSVADRWILSRLVRLVGRATEAFRNYDYAAALHETEQFFWSELADNYLEMVKKRLYEGSAGEQAAARYALHRCLRDGLRLFAPILPHITEEVYRGLLAADDGHPSIHLTAWPSADDMLVDAQAEAAGEALVAIATAVRRYKSERGLSLAAELPGLTLAAVDGDLRQALAEADRDLTSVTRAGRIVVAEQLPPRQEAIAAGSGVWLAVDGPAEVAG